MKRYLPFAIIVLVLAAGLLTARYLINSPSTRPQPSPAGSPGKTQTPVVKGESGSEPPQALGKVDAPVTLEEFGDFECPPCGLLHPILKKFEADYGPDKLRIIFRHFPLVPNDPHAPPRH